MSSSTDSSPRKRKQKVPPNIRRNKCSISPGRRERGTLSDVNIDLYQHLSQLKNIPSFISQLTLLYSCWANPKCKIQLLKSTKTVSFASSQPNIVFMHAFSNNGSTKLKGGWFKFALYWNDDNNKRNKYLRHSLIEIVSKDLIKVVPNTEYKGLKDRLLFSNVNCETAYLQLTSPTDGIALLKISPEELALASDLLSTNALHKSSDFSANPTDAIKQKALKASLTSASNAATKGQRDTKAVIAALRVFSNSVITGIVYTTTELTQILKIFTFAHLAEIKQAIKEHSSPVKSRSSSPVKSRSSSPKQSDNSNRSSSSWADQTENNSVKSDSSAKKKTKKRNNKHKKKPNKTSAQNSPR